MTDLSDVLLVGLGAMAGSIAGSVLAESWRKYRYNKALNLAKDKIEAQRKGPELVRTAAWEAPPPQPPRGRVSVFKDWEYRKADEGQNPKTE